MVSDPMVERTTFSQYEADMDDNLTTDTSVNERKQPSPWSDAIIFIIVLVVIIVLIVILVTLIILRLERAKPDVRPRVRSKKSVANNLTARDQTMMKSIESQRRFRKSINSQPNTIDATV